MHVWLILGLYESQECLCKGVEGYDLLPYGECYYIQLYSLHYIY